MEYYVTQSALIILGPIDYDIDYHRSNTMADVIIKKTEIAPLQKYLQHFDVTL